MIEQIADWDNLLLAFKKARKGKRSRDEVKAFAADLWLNLGNIQNRLLSGSYQMGRYRQFVVYEPKRREILAAPFSDRVVQHAILNVLEPIWDKCMIDDTYACRVNKGTHAGVDRIQFWLRNMVKNQPLEKIWVVKTDFSGYFKNLRHSDLKMVSRRRIDCPATLKVIDTIIDSTEGGVGIPVGNLTSQWLANLLGNELDQRIKRQLHAKRYLRYMDDCVAIFSTKAEADWFLDRLQTMSSEYGLRFSKYSVHRASQGINALGFRIWPTHKLLRKRSIRQFRRDIKHIKRRIASGDASATSITTRVKSFVAHAGHADAWRIKHQLFAEAANHSNATPPKAGVFLST